MFEYFEILKNVTQFELDTSPNSVILLKRDTAKGYISQYSISEKKELKLFTADEIYEFLLLQDFILCTNVASTVTYCIDKKNSTYFSCEYVLHLSGHTVDNKFYCYADYKSKSGFIEINLDDLAVLNFWSSPLGINGVEEIVGDCFLSKKHKTLSLFTFSNREVWTVDFSKKHAENSANLHGEEIKGVKVSGSIIFTQLKNHDFIGVNTLTGAIVWQRSMPSTFFFLPVVDDEHVYYLATGPHSGYWIIDIKTGAIHLEINYLSENIIDRKLFTHPSVTKEYFIFSATRTHEIFLLDQTNAQIRQIISLQVCSANIPIDNRPEIHGNMLFQLDGDNRLHIFADIHMPNEF